MKKMIFGVCVNVFVAKRPAKRICAAILGQGVERLADAEDWLVAAAIGAADRLSRGTGLMLTADDHAKVWETRWGVALMAGAEARIAHPLAEAHFSDSLGLLLWEWAVESLGAPIGFSEEAIVQGDMVPRAAEMIGALTEREGCGFKPESVIWTFPQARHRKWTARRWPTES